MYPSGEAYRELNKIKSVGHVNKLSLPALCRLKQVTDFKRERLLMKSGPEVTTNHPVTRLAERVDVRIAEMRSALLSAVSEQDLIDITQKLVERAKSGDCEAAKVVLERVFGKAAASMALTADVTSQHEADPDLTEMLQKLERKFLSGEGSVAQ